MRGLLTDSGDITLEKTDHMVFKRETVPARKGEKEKELIQLDLREDWTKPPLC